MKKRSVLLAIIILIGIFMIQPAKADDCFGQGVECGPPPACPNHPAPLTPGYWKTHPESWTYCFPNNSVPLDEINICCTSCQPCSCEDCTVMDKTEAIQYMLMPVEGDKTFTMFDALVAAKLNRLAGADVSCINPQINLAAFWICQHPVGSGVAASSDAWQVQGEALYEALDNYNNYGCLAP